MTYDLYIVLSYIVLSIDMLSSMKISERLHQTNFSDNMQFLHLMRELEDKATDYSYSNTSYSNDTLHVYIIWAAKNSLLNQYIF